MRLHAKNIKKIWFAGDVSSAGIEISKFEDLEILGFGNGNGFWLFGPKDSLLRKTKSQNLEMPKSQNPALL